MTSSTSSSQVRSSVAHECSPSRYSSRACRTFARARCRMTLWLVSLRSRALRTSSDVQPSTSRSVITVRCTSGSTAIAAATTLHRLRSDEPFLRKLRPATRCGGPVTGPPISLRRGSGRARRLTRRRRTSPPTARERHAASLPRAACLRDVGDDPEDPRLERGTALEAIDACDDAEPRLLNDLLGDGARGDVHPRDAEHRGAVFVDERRRTLPRPRAEAPRRSRPDPEGVHTCRRPRPRGRRYGSGPAQSSELRHALDPRSSLPRARKVCTTLSNEPRRSWMAAASAARRTLIRSSAAALAPTSEAGASPVSGAKPGDRDQDRESRQGSRDARESWVSTTGASRRRREARSSAPGRAPSPGRRYSSRVQCAKHVKGVAATFGSIKRGARRQLTVNGLPAYTYRARHGRRRAVRRRRRLVRGPDPK